jgi:hypothetical protein
MVENHHSYTALLLLVYALLILVGAILFTVAQVKVTGTTEYKNGNSKLNSAKNNLIIAYALGYVAAGMGILLAILYFGHVAWGITSEVPHLIVFILLFVLVIVSGIFGFIALSDVNGSGLSDKTFITNWIWGAEAVGLIALILLIISGAWRASYLASKTTVVAPVVTDTQREITITAPDTTVYSPPTPTVVASSPIMSAPSYPAPMV